MDCDLNKSLSQEFLGETTSFSYYLKVQKTVTLFWFFLLIIDRMQIILLFSFIGIPHQYCTLQTSYEENALGVSFREIFASEFSAINFWNLSIKRLLLW